jgi:zinc/manganese transport system substrate-binding protein
MPGRRMLTATALTAVTGLAAACSSSGASETATATTGVVTAVGAENEYANVISQIGGKYVRVSAIESNPNTDPHTFETSASDASVISGAELIVQNGAGYDSYMDKIESATPNTKRKVIVVQQLLGLPADVANPHLWYAPATMPAVAREITADLSALRPAHAAYFRASLARFDASLQPWLTAIAQVKSTYHGTAVAVTEPVADYLLQAMGLTIATPFGLQADIMNGVDLSPQYVTLQENLLSQRKVSAFLYNQQVTDALTATFLSHARSAGVPVVGVYETMPVPGYSYQSWMLAEVNAIRKAIADKVSTQRLGG